MAAQGFQPQNGSGCGDYEAWANSDQYGQEDWDNFAYMQETSTTNFQYDENHPDDERYWQDEEYEADGQTFATGHTMGTDLRPGEKLNAKTAPSFDGSMSWFLFLRSGTRLGRDHSSGKKLKEVLASGIV